MAKGGQKKQSISGQRQQRGKEPGGAETGAGGCNKPVSQKIASKKAARSLADRLRDECDFRNIDSSEVEACCHYEYFRESGAMREAFNRNWSMPLIGYRNNDFFENGGLRFMLIKVGFPTPWKRLSVIPASVATYSASTKKLIATSFRERCSRLS
jgi:hypothetical protein